MWSLKLETLSKDPHKFIKIFEFWKWRISPAQNRVRNRVEAKMKLRWLEHRVFWKSWTDIFHLWIKRENERQFFSLTEKRQKSDETESLGAADLKSVIFFLKWKQLRDQHKAKIVCVQNWMGIFGVVGFLLALTFTDLPHAHSYTRACETQTQNWGPFLANFSNNYAPSFSKGASCRLRFIHRCMPGIQGAIIGAVLINGKPTLIVWLW